VFGIPNIDGFKDLNHVPHDTVGTLGLGFIIFEIILPEFVSLGIDGRIGPLCKALVTFAKKPLFERNNDKSISAINHVENDFNAGIYPKIPTNNILANQYVKFPGPVKSDCNCAPNCAYVF